MASSWSNLPNRESARADLSTILEKAQACIGASGVAIALKTDHPAEIECYARTGRTSPPLGTAALDEGSWTAYCLRTGQRLLCEDATTDPRVASTPVVDLGVRSLALTPIRMGGRTVGALTAFSDVVHAFSAAHLAHLETASRQISDVLETKSRTADAAVAVKPQEVQPLEVNLFASVYGPTQRFRMPGRSLILQSEVLALLLLAGLATWGYRAIPKQSRATGTSHPAQFTAFAPTKTSGAGRTSATLTIDPGAVIVHRMDNFTLHVNVSAVPDSAFVAMQVTYDPNLMQFVDLTRGADRASTADQGLLAHRDDPLTGILKISAQPPGHSDRGVVVGLVFRAKGTGNTKVLVASGARDDQGRHLDVSDANVAVTIN